MPPVPIQLKVFGLLMGMTVFVHVLVYVTTSKTHTQMAHMTASGDLEKAHTIVTTALWDNPESALKPTFLKGKILPGDVRLLVLYHNSRVPVWGRWSVTQSGLQEKYEKDGFPPHESGEIFSLEHKNTYWLATSVPVYPAGLPHLSIILFKDGSGVAAPMRGFRHFLMLLFAFSFAFCTFVTLYLSKIVTKPIQQIKDKAKMVADGNFLVDPRIDRNDEIGQLSNTLAQMKDILVKQIHQNQAVNKKLSLKNKRIRQANDELAKKLAETEILLALSQYHEESGEQSQASQLWDHILVMLRRLYKATSVHYLTYNSQAGSFQSAHSHGPRNEEADQEDVRFLANLITSESLKSGNIQTLEDQEQRANLIIPLSGDETIHGFILIRRPLPLIKPDFLFLLTLAHHLVLILDNQELQTLAVHDDLTGLYNSRHVHRSLKSWMEIQDGALLPVSLVLFDIDHFKAINDTYGHPVGDMVLREVGTLVRSHLRAQDVGGRCGGEEFAVLLPRTDLDQALIVAERLRNAFENHSIVVKGQVIGVTVSLGVATSPLHGTSGPEIFEAADKALYVSKRGGRNRLSSAAELDEYKDRPAS